MKFPINRRVFIAVCLFLIGLTLSGCSAQVTECPESLQVVVNDKNSVLLSWGPVDNAIGYRVYRRISGSPDFKFVTDTEATYYTDLQPEPGSYDYQVTALGPHGESAGIIFLAIYVTLDGAGTRPFWFNVSRFWLSLAANTALAILTADILSPDDRK